MDMKNILNEIKILFELKGNIINLINDLYKQKKELLNKAVYYTLEIEKLRNLYITEKLRVKKHKKGEWYKWDMK